MADEHSAQDRAIFIIVSVIIAVIAVMMGFTYVNQCLHTCEFALRYPYGHPPTRQ